MLATRQQESTHAARSGSVWAIALLIAGLGVDFGRRVGRIDRRVANSSDASRRALSDHEVTVRLTDFAAGTSHVTLRVTSGREHVAEVELLEIELGGSQPLPNGPRVARTASDAPLDFTLAFRDVAWQRSETPPRFRATLRHRCRIRYADETADRARVETRTTSLEVESGAAYTAMLAAFGVPR